MCFFSFSAKPLEIHHLNQGEKKKKKQSVKLWIPKSNSKTQ
uniref:Uncharacterized protein n=1 Tax=Rhizophora mucronata TaxID=61149 RepID=A0A2P2Q0R3_RHIMU